MTENEFLKTSLATVQAKYSRAKKINIANKMLTSSRATLASHEDDNLMMIQKILKGEIKEEEAEHDSEFEADPSFIAINQAYEEQIEKQRAQLYMKFWVIINSCYY